VSSVIRASAKHSAKTRRARAFRVPTAPHWKPSTQISRLGCCAPMSWKVVHRKLHNIAPFTTVWYSTFHPFCCLRWSRKMGKLFRQLHGLLADSTKGLFGCFEDSPSLFSQYQFSKPTAAWMLRLCSLQRVLAIRILQCSQSCKAHSLSVLRTARILQP
jgi:hypothetical protein